MEAKAAPNYIIVKWDGQPKPNAYTKLDGSMDGLHHRNMHLSHSNDMGWYVRDTPVPVLNGLGAAGYEVVGKDSLLYRQNYYFLKLKREKRLKS